VALPYRSLTRAREPDSDVEREGQTGSRGISAAGTTASRADEGSPNDQVLACGARKVDRATPVGLVNRAVATLPAHTH
jgi:hypothetical protein